MSMISSLSVAQLQRAVAIKTQIEALVQELESLEGNGAPVIQVRRSPGRPRLNAAVKVAPTAEEPRKKRKMSRAVKAKMAAAAKARWAKIKAEQAVTA